jgi:hypothetical protein
MRSGKRFGACAYASWPKRKSTDRMSFELRQENLQKIVARAAQSNDKLAKLSYVNSALASCPDLFSASRGPGLREEKVDGELRGAFQMRTRPRPVIRLKGQDFGPAFCFC